MQHKVYKKVELIGKSSKSIEDAIQNAIKKASATVRNMIWFEVVETSGYIDNDQIVHWQVTIKVSFTVED